MAKDIPKDIVAAFETLVASASQQPFGAWGDLASSVGVDGPKFGLDGDLFYTQARAAVVASAVHFAQTDKSGAPYIDHPARVHRIARDLSLPAGGFSSAQTEAALCAALLHDVIEDSEEFFHRHVSAADLKALGFSSLTIELVELLTFNAPAGVTEVEKLELKQAYLERIAANPLARAVKLADTCDNMNTARQAVLTAEEQAQFAKKYGNYMTVLDFDPATEWFANSINN